MRPKGKDNKREKRDMGNTEIRTQIDKLIAAEYTPRPEWLDEKCRDTRNQYLMIEYQKLQRVNGLTAERARQVLAALINRSIETVNGILYR
jgi:hypothetical protein